MKVLLSVAVLLSSASAFAGGSISKQDALAHVASENPALASALSKLDLADEGSALRAGRHMGELGGARLIPFTFASKDGSLTIVIDNDQDGKLMAIVK